MNIGVTIIAWFSVGTKNFPPRTFGGLQTVEFPLLFWNSFILPGTFGRLEAVVSLFYFQPFSPSSRIHSSNR